VSLTYPETQQDRDRWILERRRQRTTLNPREPYAYFVEDECSDSGEIVPVATILLTNAECPFRCVMCDLWRNTLEEHTNAGAIPEQIEFALARLPRASALKLYNSGSFFDTRAIPPEDYSAIAGLIKGFGRVIVECHPAFIGKLCLEFRDLIEGKLEIAIGLETAHREVLAKLNKRMTLEQFAGAAAFLGHSGIGLRAFVLVQPPFMAADDALEWAQRSLEYAFDHGAGAATLIPTRGGNGAMEALAANGDFSPPDLRVVEMAMQYGLSLCRGRVFADLWSLKRGVECPGCFNERVARLRAMNLSQQLAEPVRCNACEAA